jgi:hypothetical protein
MKVYTTTPTHDRPFIMGPNDLLTMLDMHTWWKNNPDTITKVNDSGSDMFLFVNPNQVEWSYMPLHVN